MRNAVRRILRLAAAAVLMTASASKAAESADANVTAQFDAANQLYEAKQFDKAKDAYDRMVKNGPLSANLFYNRGNAQWKLGNGGAAVADYERALALDPGDQQARVNLDFVRDQTGAKTAMQQWWEHALEAMDASSATVLLSVCGWVALFCLALVLLRPEGRTGPIVTLTMSLLVGAYASGSIWQANLQGTKAIVVAKSAPAHVAPADVAPIADVLPAGSEVLAPETRGPWTYCTLPDGDRAWIPTDALEKVKG
jgi:tetratricopeptide (TPR) repeat protein